MAGGIQKRGENSWRLSYHVGYDANGKRIRRTKTVKCKNRSEAEKELAKFITEVEQGEYVAPSHTRFGDYVKVWRKQSEKKLAPSTIENYDIMLQKRILPALAHHKIEDVSHIHIIDFLETLEQLEYTSSTMNKYYTLLNSIFKLAYKNEMIKKNPLDKVDKPQVRNQESDVYNSTELKELYQLLNQEENKQQVLIIKLALTTGMRRGEILALQWEDIDFKTGTIHIRHSLSYTKQKGYILKEPKTKGSIRKVAPPNKIMQELKRHIQLKRQDKMKAEELWEGGKHNFVFTSDMGKPLHKDVPSTWFQRFLERHHFKKIRFHDLRHTSATDLINRGANIHSISKRLGHANITTTMNIYGHYLEEADQKIADMLDEDYI